jgi:hypothetical protein
MTDITTNPYNLEFRDGRGCRLVVYNKRNIARITQDGTLMTHATEAARVGNVLDSLNLSKAMFLVESEEQLQGVLSWPGLRNFARLTLNLYFVPDPQWMMGLLREHARHLQHMEFLDISGVVPLPPLLGDEALRLFENIPERQVMGYR